VSDILRFLQLSTRIVDAAGPLDEKGCGLKEVNKIGGNSDQSDEDGKSNIIILSTCRVVMERTDACSWQNRRGQLSMSDKIPSQLTLYMFELLLQLPCSYVGGQSHSSAVLHGVKY
jgi:hypothetical protein